MLKLDSVSYSYSDQYVLDKISLDVEAGEIMCLLGQSGSGKTTLLRLITGLLPGYQGSVVFDNQQIDTLAVHERQFGLMFQDFALFPHMNVSENIAFGLKMLRISSKQQAEIVQDMLTLVGLQGFNKRDISSLSGGEKQRVALARCLAPSPKLIMLDEPLGSLDANLRDRLTIELRDIIKSLGLTAIYVTHDQQEAFAIADRIAIINQGRIEQVDTPLQMYHHPRTIFTAQFLGLQNVVDMHFFDANLISIAPSTKHVLIHPDFITINPDGAYTGRVIHRIYKGNHHQLLVQIGATDLLIRVPLAMGIPPQIDDRVTFDVAPDGLIPLMS